MELAEVIHNRQANLIVMGTTGRSKRLEKLFYGKQCRPSNWKLSCSSVSHPKMEFAYNGFKLKELEKFPILNSFRNVLKVGIHVFQITDNKQSQPPHLTNFIHFLSGAQYDDIDEKEVESGILKYIELNHLD